MAVNRRLQGGLLALVVVALAVVWWVGPRESSTPARREAPTPIATPTPSPSPPRTPAAAPTPTTPPSPSPTSSPALDLRAVADADERAAITAVVAAIDRGGPFAYRKDGATFENREGRLPRRARGYWREYTVPTPGSPDRGARRLVGGDRRELYYSRDHYRSFTAVRAAMP